MSKKRVVFILILLLIAVLPFGFLVSEISSDELDSSNSELSVSFSPYSGSSGSRLKGLYTANSEMLEGYFQSEVTIAAAGDLMVHSPQFFSAYNASTGTYDFSKHFSRISPYLIQADLTLANLETTLTGPQYPYSGYPRFNTPPELAENLKDAGFDLLFTANNHSLDYGETGALNTIEHIEAAGLDFVGTARNEEERKRGSQVTINNIELAFFAYTYGTNGIPVPQGKEYLVTLIDEETIITDTERAREQGADAVIVSLHWGQEYQRLPTQGQRDLAKRLIDGGVDVIVGTHPHVVQPAEIIQTDNNSGLVLYSLGNFISNQRKRYRDSGIIVYFTLEKDLAMDQVTVSLAEIEPTWVLRRNQLGPERYSILPVNDLLADKAKLEAENLSPQDINRMQEVVTETEDIFWRYWD